MLFCRFTAPWAEIALASLKKYAVFFKTEISELSDPQEAQHPTDLERLRTGSAEVVARNHRHVYPADVKS